MPENKHLRFLLYVVYAVLGYFFVVKLCPQILKLLLPFILAFIVAWIANPLFRLLKNKLKFPKWLATTVSLVFILVILSGLLTIAINRIITEITQFIQQIPAIIDSVSKTMSGISDRWSVFSSSLSPEMALHVNDAISSLASMLISLLSPLTKFTINSATSFATSLPSMLIFAVVFILSCIFMTGDYEKIKRNLMLQIPVAYRNKVSLIKTYTGIALGKYLKGMGIILLITFSELLVGFIIIDAPYAFTLAIIIAIVDIFPVLGTGTILIPWAAFSAITGDFRFAISLFVIYLLVLVVRQFIEPKVMSSSLGTYPLVTLVSMYVGLKLFGVLGMIGGPIVMLVLIYLQQSKVLKFWKMEEN